ALASNALIANSSCAVWKTTLNGRASSWLSTSKPESTGISTSRSTTSGANSRARAIASSPPAASRRSQSTPPSSTKRLILLRASRSSSTTRILSLATTLPREEERSLRRAARRALQREAVGVAVQQRQPLLRVGEAGALAGRLALQRCPGVGD